MAKYLLFEFDDDQLADDRLESLKEHGPPGLRVVAVWKKPTLFCDCPPDQQGKSKRGAKYGWYICTTCKKCRPGFQCPVNLLHPPDLPIQKRDEFMTRWEGPDPENHHKDPSLHIYERPERTAQ
jgi:hypothetical protein